MIWPHPSKQSKKTTTTNKQEISALKHHMMSLRHKKSQRLWLSMLMRSNLGRGPDPSSCHCKIKKVLSMSLQFTMIFRLVSTRNWEILNWSSRAWMTTWTPTKTYCKMQKAHARETSQTRNENGTNMALVNSCRIFRLKVVFKDHSSLTETVCIVVVTCIRVMYSTPV